MESFAEQLQQRQTANMPPSILIPSCPTIRHTTTVAAPRAAPTSVGSKRNSRLRSGSLMLPSAGLSSPSNECASANSALD
ncbi:uncharacterized protein HD556DRAFT_1409963 [Suillus plorans]|uniref:Uncharacterized protein n=1 Tax=Suillus plorans TaxID=116603 RepID=A0A9P7DCG6_9AGAM|nr:uncharacterized protein HD556DRAFT_1409963 [Suillus plorans]KAG1787253.1 hypothetical protein HD556DRAFT_1409963 [Suillus plorans]